MSILRDAVQSFLSQYKKSSRTSYAYDLRHFVNFVGATRELAGLTTLHLAEYGEALDKKNVAIGTWNKRVKSIRVFFNWCRRNGMIDSSPAQFLKVRRKRGNVKRELAISDGDFETILNYAMVTRDTEMIALVLFAGDTGCRRGGVATLRWVDIDFNKREGVVTEKGDATRLVAWGELCNEALKNWQATKKAPVYVFSLTEKPLSPASISQKLRRLCKKAGVPGRGIHALRHRKGWQLSDSRISPTISQVVMGHASVTTTMEHYYPKDWERSKQALEELATKAPAPPDNKVIQFPKKLS